MICEVGDAIFQVGMRWADEHQMGCDLILGGINVSFALEFIRVCNNLGETHLVCAISLTRR